MDSSVDPAIEALTTHEHDPQSSAHLLCVDVSGAEARLGGTVRYTAHLCISQAPHAVEGVVREVAVWVDPWASDAGIREAMADSATADRVRRDLARVAVRNYLLRDTAVGWKARPLD